ncbi:MAG: hypothetical protein ACPL7B_10875 [Candidatus Poribacteria bacterium]
MKDLIALTMRDQRRFEVIKESLEGKLKMRDASLILGLSMRQIYQFKIVTISEANKYLKEIFIPRWNERFSRKARDEMLAYMSIPSGIDLREVLCIRDERKVYPDNTISYKGIKYQILPDGIRSSYAKAEVEIYEHLDGALSITYKGRKLKYIKQSELYDGEDEEHTLEELYTDR